MQSASLSSTPLLLNKFSKLVKQVFQRYEQAQSVHDFNISAEEQKKIVLIELEALFGEVLDDALHLLDKGTITVYRSEDQHREVAEIQAGCLSLAPSVYLYPCVNFCHCDHFTRCVLGLSHLENFANTEIGCDCGQSYTCAHVVALSLAELFQLPPPTLQLEVVTEQQFQVLLKQMHCYSEITI